MKVENAITVFRTEDGNYGIKITAKDPLISLGLLDIGRSLVMKNFEGAEESKIVMPEGRL